MASAETETKAPENVENKENEQKASNVKIYKEAEVGEHNTEKDCWVIIHGNVYDVTKYLDDHPGGPEIIMDIAGTDATEEFEDTGHSADARDILKGFMIGQAEVTEKSKKAAVAKSSSSSSSNSTLLIVGFLVAILAAAYAMFGDKLK